MKREPARSALHAEEALDRWSVHQLLRHPASRLVSAGAGERLPERGRAYLASDHDALAPVVVRFLQHAAIAVAQGRVVDVVEQPRPGDELGDRRALFAGEELCALGLQ